MYPTLVFPDKAKVALAQDTDLAGTGIRSGEGGMLPADFIKAIVLDADAFAVTNSAIQSIGYLDMRASNPNWVNA